MNRYALTHVLPGLAGLFLTLALWWTATDLLAAPGSLAARFSPVATWLSLRELLGDPQLGFHVWASLRRIAVGLALALLIGMPLGLAVGAWQRADALLSPTFQFLRMVSPLSWMPIAVMVLGVGDAPVYFLLAFAGVWPIILNTAAGVRQLDPRWLQLARSLAATRAETLLRVVLPGILAHVLTGVRLAIGILWIVLVPAEMLGVSAGVGYFILDTRDRLAYSELMAMVLLVGLLGYALDMLARQAYRALGRR